MDVVKNLVYFKRWMAPNAIELLAEHKDISVKKLEVEDEAMCWSELSQAHGYQSLPRTESGGQWLPSADLVAKCPKLLAVASAGAGYDVIDVDACTEHGIIVCNNSGANREAVAEHAIGFMLSLSKKITYWDHVMRKVPDVDRFTVEGNDLFRKTVGIVGLGQIGGQVAKICKAAFDMQVIAYDPYLTESEIAAKGAIKVDLARLLEESDFVSVHCPLTEETQGMIAEGEFSRMKPGAYFVTLARGGVHSEDALVQALREGRIAGAGIDVFSVEPPPLDHPLMAFDNVSLTPHMGGITVEATAETAAMAVRQWVDIFQGKVPSGLKNPEAWPKYSARFEQILGFTPQSL